MVQQDRNIMALVYVLAHARSLRRKQRGIYPLVIQYGQIGREPERYRSQLSPHAHAWGPSKGSEGFDQSRVAQCQFSRLCRLYADGRILECTGRINDAKSARPKRDHVRRGCPVALPPLADRRCAGHAWLGGQTYHVARESHPAYPHIICPFREGRADLSEIN